MAELHLEENPNEVVDPADLLKPWYKTLTSYHWFVLIVAALGWVFDCLDQQLFTLARKPAMDELLAATPEKANFFGGISTTVFMLGWATGGLIFGVLGDKIGRAKTMMWTIIIYSVCTGLSALSVTVYDFMFYRFITGLGVGGEFAVGIALVAEVMPNRARPFALGLLQALSAVGNISAALIGIALSKIELSGGVKAWRVMFLIGILPSLLVLVIRRRMKEPEQWVALKASGGTKKLGSYSELLGHPKWRKHAILGLLLASSGVVGLWGIGFFSPELTRSAFDAKFKADNLTGTELESAKLFWAGMTMLMQNIGAFFGMYAFSRITHYIGRRPAFAIAFLLAGLSTGYVFWNLKEFNQIYWMIPMMGFCQLAIFGGYAIYFPELFPTHLRSTGTSFCYNIGRYVSAIGPFFLGVLTIWYQGLDHEPIRYAGVTMCGVFLLGLMVLPFLPETKGKPLPE